MEYVEKTLTGIIESGQSSITFTDDFITDNSIVDVFFSDDDINPTEQTQTGNRVIIDILPLDHNISIAVRVTNADVIDYNSEIESIEDTLTSHSGVLSSHGTEIINLRHDVTDIETEQALIVQDISDLSSNKQDKLTAGENITIENNVISSSGGSSQEVYDSTERVIGTWFGKPLYRKVMIINSLPSVAYSLTQYPHGITNIDRIIKYDISMQFNNSDKTSSSQARNFPSANYAGDIIQLGHQIDKTNLSIMVNVNRNSCSAYVIIEYTKVGD